MSSVESRVIVTVGITAQSSCVYHRDFAEIRAEGVSPRAAAAQLSNELTRALDSALTDWRRSTLNQAISDVQEFVAQAT